MPKRLEPSERQAILDDIQAGKLARNAIARKHGRSVSTITGIAQSSGATNAFDRSQTEKGTQARSADMAELRSLTKAKLLRKANDLIDQMDDAHLVFAFGGKENDYNEHILERAPTGDLRNLMTSAAIALDKHMALDKHDSDDHGGAAVDSWLRHVLGSDVTAF